LSVFAGITLAGVVGWFVLSPQYTEESSEIPVIRRPQTAIKIRPENPGGMDIPNQDKEVYNIVEKNNIRIDSYYSGSMDNMKNRQKEYYIERNNESTKKRIDYVLKTDGHDIVVEEYKYPDVHQIQIMVLKDKDGKSYLSYICPYKMFFPYRKADARKKEIRTRQILAGGNLCHFCKFMKGKDIKNGLLFCEGFKNKGSKNLYDNLKLNFYELNEEYQKYLEYKKTDEYRQIETVLMKNGG
jgi:hypothetical protein